MAGAVAFSLVILLHWSPSSSTPVLASGPATRSIKPGGGNKKVEACPASCGNLSFDYPFGIGPECSRGPDFRLTCDDATRPPKLFLADGITEVIDSMAMDIDFDGSNYYKPRNQIKTSIWLVVPMKSGVRVYNLSLEPPGRSFSRDSARLNITGCDLDVYWVNQVAGRTTWACSTWCHGEEEITEMAARHNCTGIGCCTIEVIDEGELNGESVQEDFRLSIVVHGHNQSGSIGTSRFNRTSLLRDRITVSSDDAMLQWSIVDEPNCLATSKSHKNYACISNNSICYDQGMTSSQGYLCLCDIGYTGNPYIRDGCTEDNKEYNPNQRRADCTRQCGNISVQFPFGLEEGCFARRQFRLSCTNATSSGVLNMEDDSPYRVIDLNVNEGTINFTNLDQEIGDFYALVIAGGLNLFVGYDVSTSLQWVAANLSCTEAKQNISEYACVSINSSCVEVNALSGYFGYHCKCPYGFKGNPYIQNGCQDVDECLQQDICKGRVCSNIEGGFTCTECPRKTEYDPTKNQCTRTKQQVLFKGDHVYIGIMIGLSGGFSILLLSFVALFLFRRWKKNVQKQLRKNYFHKNQGILLEQLISPDKTIIFPLEELEKATNNFDPARIIGRGGHGMVYKGILSDQHVVAIKKSLVIEYSEIREFINEVAILSEINHRNIVKLFGCCLESEVPLLVYDYISNGSLSQALHAESRNDVSLVWDDYIRIATEAAGALSYLHSAASISVFHRDVKSANILLDGNYTAKVSDFGASRLVPVGQTHIDTNVQGTYGYLDPEYVHTRQLNEKSDVYSFGVVLLELLVRKKPVFKSNSGWAQSLSNYFLEALKEKEITDIVDSQVAEEATKEEISSVASLAEMCLRLYGEERPTMKEVEMELQILQKKRASSGQSSLENEEQNETMLPARRAEATCQAFAIEPGEGANLPLKHNQRCSSLEEEIMESATLPH
ncbi:unnamed protein product [Miscanthus lutarioriparius]|uniref:Protein kinase domain-containing protein n=1 Tax=Miscanthus lutarioriparius TaxID=422564 RepID=A0A811QEZ8_9POAL|nr:unnamed protein product [Miscanthus lutarioriparius]